MKTMPCETELVAKATKDYHRRFGPEAANPSSASSANNGVLQLVNCNGTLATYRVGPTGRLMFQPPEGE
jgi:hypothetical protein